MKQRSICPNASRPGQGRPIGLLVDWLCKHTQEDSADDHKRIDVGDFAERAAARELFAEFDGSDFFFNLERDVEAGEGDEPERIP